MEEENRKWADMEADCLSVIFQTLAVDDRILSLPFVCKSWSAAAVDPRCWNTLDLRQLDFMPWSSFAIKFSSLYPISLFSLSSLLKHTTRRSSGHLVELRFPSAFTLSTTDLLLLSNTCPKLRVLALPTLLLEHELQIPELVQKWEELEYLEMESKPVSFLQLAEQIRTNCSNFRELKMSGSIKREDAVAIVECLPKIKKLNLNRSCISKEQLMMVLHGCRGLEEVRVSECVGFESGDDEIKKIVEGMCSVRIFEDGESKLVDDFDYEKDDCEPFCLVL